MRGGSDHIGDTNGRGIDARYHQTGYMGDIREQVSANLVGDLPKTQPIDLPRIRRHTGDDHLRFVFQGQGLDIIIVDLFCFRIDGVGDDIEIFSRAVDWRTVREMSPKEQVHAHDVLAWLHQSMIDGVIGRASREGLHIDIDIISFDIIRGKGFCAAPPRQGFDNIGIFDALVVAWVGIAPILGDAHIIIKDLFFG